MSLKCYHHMLDFLTNMHQIQFRLGLRHRRTPLKELSLLHSPDLLALGRGLGLAAPPQNLTPALALLASIRPEPYHFGNVPGPVSYFHPARGNEFGRICQMRRILF